MNALKNVLVTLFLEQPPLLSLKWLGLLFFLRLILVLTLFMSWGLAPGAIFHTPPIEKASTYKGILVQVVAPNSSRRVRGIVVRGDEGERFIHAAIERGGPNQYSPHIDSEVTAWYGTSINQLLLTDRSLVKLTSGEQVIFDAWANPELPERLAAWTRAFKLLLLTTLVLAVLIYLIVREGRKIDGRSSF